MATARVFLKQLQGITFAARTGSRHWVMVDGPEMFEGSSAAVSPKELLLVALGGCTASDVVTILKKKRSPLQGFELEISAQESEEHPRVYTEIHMEFLLYGEGIRAADVERAIELSQTKYCAVTAMLKASVTITTSFRTLKPEQQASQKLPLSRRG